MIRLLTKALDGDAEVIRRNHHDAIAELQAAPFSVARIIRDVTLADGVATPIAHGLGRRVMAFVSPVRNAVSNGRLEEMRDGSHKPEQYVVLKATGFGAVVSVDLVVF